MTTRSPTEQASIAIAYERFVKGWQLENELTIMIQFPKSNPYLISTIFEGNIPVAVITYNKNTFSLNTFVAEEYRGKGYGSQIIEKAIQEHGLQRNQIYGGYGIQGSDTFYRKNNIVFFKNGINLDEQEMEDFINYRKTYEEIIKNKIAKEYEKILEENKNLKNSSQEKSSKLSIA